MVSWETADRGPSISPVEREFAQIWPRLSKVVFSTTLDSVVGNATLKREGLVQEAQAQRARTGGDVAVGGAGLAGELIRQRLIDEYRLFISPVVAGGGTPFFPILERPLGLERLETREVGQGLVYMRYRSM